MNRNDRKLWRVRQADFLPEPDRDCPGVYLYETDDRHIAYVGQSVHILKRRSEHRRAGRLPVDDLNLRVYPLKSLQDRLLLETLLVLRYRPLLNRTIKLGIANDGRLTELAFVPHRRTRKP